MSYHNTSQNRTTTPSNILTYISGVPLFRTIQQALAYGQQVGLNGYHTHVFQGVTGYMAGFDHTDASRITQSVTVEQITSVINSFIIDDTDLTTLSSKRDFTINGDIGSKFILQVIQKSSSSSVFEKYYNFKTNLFETPTMGINVNHYLREELNSNTFTNSINFPSGTSGGYKILLIADPDSKTNLSTSLSSSSVFSKDINDVGNTTVTFVFKTTNTSTYASNPPSANLTLSAPLGFQQLAKTLDISKTLTNTSSDANGFGLRVTSVFNINTGIYCEKTHTVNGAVSSSKTIVLDSVDNLVVGATITGVSGGDSVSGTPVIETIDIENKTITITGNNQSFSDGGTLTFRITGNILINEAFNLDVSENNLSQLTSSIIENTALSASTGNLNLSNIISVNKTVRGSVSADAGASGGLNLNGTYGIAGGNHVTVLGNGFRRNVTVSSVNTPSSSAGAVTTNVGHNDLVASENLTFVGSTQALTLNNCQLVVNSFPSSDITVNIDLDSFITPGAAS